MKGAVSPSLLELTNRIQRLPIASALKPDSCRKETTELADILINNCGRDGALSELAKFEERYLPAVKANVIAGPLLIGTLVYLTYFSASNLLPDNTFHKSIMTFLFGMYAGLGMPTIIRNYLRVRGARLLRSYISHETKREINKLKMPDTH